MTLRLYEFSVSRSVRVHWLLRELGVEFETVKVDLSKGEGQTPEFLRINPNGKVPVLVDGDFAVWESAAICTYLADKYPEKKMVPPAGSRERALYNQWMFWCMSEFEQPLWTLARHKRIYPEKLRVPQIESVAKYEFKKMAAILEKELEHKLYILGKDFYAADILLGHTCMWASAIKLLDEFSNLQRYLEALKKRPAFPSELYSN